MTYSQTEQFYELLINLTKDVNKSGIHSLLAKDGQNVGFILQGFSSSIVFCCITCIKIKHIEQMS